MKKIVQILFLFYSVFGPLHAQENQCRSLIATQARLAELSDLFFNNSDVNFLISSYRDDFGNQVHAISSDFFQHQWEPRSVLEDLLAFEQEWQQALNRDLRRRSLREDLRAHFERNIINSQERLHYIDNLRSLYQMHGEEYAQLLFCTNVLSPMPLQNVCVEHTPFSAKEEIERLDNQSNQNYRQEARTQILRQIRSLRNNISNLVRIRRQKQFDSDKLVIGRRILLLRRQLDDQRALLERIDEIAQANENLMIELSNCLPALVASYLRFLDHQEPEEYTVLDDLEMDQRAAERERPVDIINGRIMDLVRASSASSN